MFGKKTKKLNGKVRRRIRKTTAVVLLISAIVVAAIPVPEAAAAPTGRNAGISLAADSDPVWELGYSVSDNDVTFAKENYTTSIPKVERTDRIFSSADDTYQFAMKTFGTDTTYRAVLLNYRPAPGDSGVLSIPGTLEAYVKYDSASMTSPSVAANGAGQWLYYRQVTEHILEGKINSDGSGWDGIPTTLPTTSWLDGSGSGKPEPKPSLAKSGIGTDNPTAKLTYYEYKYQLCYRKEAGDSDPEWYPNKNYDAVRRFLLTGNEGFSYPKDASPGNYTELTNTIFYDVPDGADAFGVTLPKGSRTDAENIFTPAGVTTDWMNKAPVGYISSQRLDKDEAEKGLWVLGTDETVPFSSSLFGITTLTLPAGFIAIGKNTFSGCTGLTTLDMGQCGQSLKEIGPSAFEGCRSLNKIVWPSTDGVTMIMEKTFKGCEALTEFAIPLDTTKIGDEAFKNCTSLKSVTFNQKLTKLGRNVFENTALETVSFPKDINITSIGRGTFKDCEKLKSVTLPEKVNSPVNYALFQGCSGLQYIDVLNNSTTFTGSVNAFKKDVEKKETETPFYFIGNQTTTCQIYNECLSKSIVFQDRTSKNFILAVKDGSAANVTYLYQIKETGGSKNISLNKLGYEGAGEPRDVVIPGKIGPYTITSIGDNFAENSRKELREKMTSIEIPSTVTAIGAKAFQGCYNLQKVDFKDPGKIVSIADGAFKTQEGAPTGTKVTPLTFYGEIDGALETFRYATKKGNNIDNTSQSTTTYIELCSGAPRFLSVKYNPEADNGNGLVELSGVPHRKNTDYLNAIKEAIDASDSISGGNPTSIGLMDAYKKYLNGEEKTFPYAPDSDVTKLVESAFEIRLPQGVQGIADGVFSSAVNKPEDTQVKKQHYDEEVVLTAQKVPATGINTDVYKVTMKSVEKLGNYAFYGCDNLNEVVMYQSGAAAGEEIGSYAFGKCEALQSVALPYTTSKIGVRPFAADEAMDASKGSSSIQFIKKEPRAAGVEIAGSTEGGNFAYEDGILYGIKGGEKVSVVQVLPSKSGELALVGSKITTIEPEAFMGSRLSILNLQQSGVRALSAYSLAQMENLIKLVLPADCSVLDYAVVDAGTPKTDLMLVGSSGNMVEPYALYSSTEKGNVKHKVQTTAQKGSNLYNLAELYNSKYGWTLPGETPASYLVTFQDDDGAEIKPPCRVEAKSIIKDGYDIDGKLILPTAKEQETFLAKYPKYAGMEISGWTPSYLLSSSITQDVTLIADIKTPPSPPAAPTTYTVTFIIDADNPIWATRTVEEATPMKKEDLPKDPGASRSGKKFIGWSNADGIKLTNKIYDNVSFVANYEGGVTAVGGGNTNTNTNSGANNNNSTNNNGTGTNNANQTLYTLTVVNGSGSGSYTADTMVTVAAYTPNPGYEFYSWTSSESDTDFSSKTLAAAAFKMPAKNLTVTANYRTKSETGNSITSKRTQGTVTSAPASNTGTTIGGTNNNNNGNNNGNAGNNAGTTGDSATDVQMYRPGISNGDVASATVNGSTDNFVVRVTEDGQATAAVAEALRNEYGSLENIRYFAMDISLYDETGTQKITDTSGLSVTTTIPIPDELRQYAGNNKVAAVTGGNNLDKLNTRFTTVNGVPCVTFTATHFSPYTIYVNTGNLLSGGYDATPKTGDGIHPKWFLAAGLALFSAVLFLKKDKRLGLGTA